MVGLNYFQPPHNFNAITLMREFIKKTTSNDVTLVIHLFILSDQEINY